MKHGDHDTVSDRSEPQRALHRMEQQNQALSILNELALDQSGTDEEKIRTALIRGADFLGLPVAILSEITGEAYLVRATNVPESADLYPGQLFSLGQTYCSILLRQQGCLAIHHMSQSPYRNHPCYRAFGLEAYIAAPVIIQGRTFGTLNFSSPDPRPHPFTDTEITFVTLLTKWLASLLEGQITARTLTKLVRQAPGMLYQYRQWPDGRSAFPYTSPGIRDIYGCSPEEVAEDASRVFERIHPDDLPAVAESIQTSSTHLSTWQHQYRVRSDRGWRWVEGRATPEKLADNSIIWHGYITDIDDKKRTQLALQESEAQLRRLFELSPIGIALNDLHTGAFLAVNDALLAPTGYHREQFLGLHPSALMAGDFPAFRSQVMRELNDTGRFGPYELTITRHDRSHYPALVQGLVIKGDAGQTLIWTLVEDISERKKVERMKNEFISSVSHELRTPLTSIAGSLGLIASGALGQLPDKVAQMVQIAARNSDQLKHLINDLLDMEKLVSGRIRMSIEPAPLFPVLAEALEQLRTYAMDREVSLALAPDHPDRRAAFDRHRLQQAVMNLLSNAIKFSPRQARVDIRIRPRPGHLRVEVSDRGPGIPSSFHPQLFEKFAQADSSTTRDQRGTGLGLAITREIMTQMGGEVGFRTRVGQGSTFWLDIPRAP